MRWKKLFSYNSLIRGENYYYDGRVAEVVKDRTHFEGTVIGNGSSYTVSLDMNGDKVSDLKCNCPHAMDRHRCKHMAAVLFAIHNKEYEERTSIQPTSMVQRYVELFKESEDDEYRYYDMAAITKNVLFKSYEVEAAKDFIESGHVTVGVNAIREFVGYGFKYLEGSGTVRDGRKSSVYVEIDRERIRNLSCNCSECYGKYYDFRYGRKKCEPCAHQIAVLIKLDEYIKEFNPGDTTDNAAKFMMDSFRRGSVTLAAAEDNSGRLVHIDPVIEYDGRYASLSFKVGLDKMYILKDITDFVQAAEEKRIFELGKKTSINFAMDRIAEDSKALFAVMAEKVHENRLASDPSYGRIIYTSRQLPLRGRILDELYAGTEGKRIEYKRVGLIKVTEGSVRPELTVKPVTSSGGIFDGVTVSGNMPETIEGISDVYTLSDDALMRIDGESKEFIQKLLPAVKDGRISMTIGRKYLTEFYYNMLPKLQSFCDVTITDEDAITEYIPPEGRFRFYMDADESLISCRPVAVYGEEEYPLVGEEGKPSSFRDSRRESDVLGMISPFFEMAVPEDNELICEEDEQKVYDILTYGLDCMMELGEVHSTDRFKRLKVRKAPKYTIGVSLESGLLNLDIGSTELSNEELLDILYSFRKKKKFHRLKNGDFVDLRDSSIEELYALFESMHISPKEFVKGKMQLPAYRALYLDKMLESNESIYADRDRHFRNLIKEFKTIKESENSVPEELKGIMRNYQIYGFKWLSTLKDYGFGGILADEMGLGKTLQMIALMKSCKEAGTSLVVCPASLVYNWQEEFFKFAPDMKTACVAGSVKERKDIIENYHDYDVLITSYDLVKRDIDKYEDLSFAFEVIDEAQYIKNHSTAAAKSVKVIKAEHKFALTGTPIENRLSELWSIFDYLMPGFLYSYADFRQEFENDIVKYGNQDSTDRLHRMVAPFILRRLKRDVLKDLPDKIEEVHYARLEGKQREIYEGQVVKMKAMLGELSNDEFRTGKIQVLAELTKLRQICCDPDLLFEEYKGESAKREACMDLVTSAIEAGHKILLFSQFTSMLEILESELKERNIAYYKITGNTKKSERVELVNEFNKNDVPVFLISLKAGGTGLNLTGADVVIHYDPWWNVAAQNQATDRAHRIGQDKIVTVYRLIARDTIEERILKLQTSKKELADSIISGDSVSITSMTKDDLMQLF